MPIFSSFRETLKPCDLVAFGVADVDHEQGDPVVACVRVGLRHQNDVVGAEAVGDEGLGAVDHVLVAIADCGGSDGGDVGAGARLGDPQAADQLTLDRGDQVALLQILGPEQVDRRRRHVGVDREAHIEPAAAAVAHRVRSHQRVEVVAPLAAVLLGVAETDVAEVGGPLQDRVRPEVLLPIEPVRGALLQHPRLHRLAQLLVLVGEDEVRPVRAVVGLEHGVGRGGHRVECRTSYFPLQAALIGSRT